MNNLYQPREKLWPLVVLTLLAALIFYIAGHAQ